MAGAASDSRAQTAPLLFTALLYLGLALLYIAAGAGLIGLSNWGRILQIVVAIIGLCGIPLGTVLSILVMIYLFKPGARALFSGRAPGTLTPAELSDLRGLRESGVGTAIVVFVIIAPVLMLLIVAAIAIPSLLHARVAANESATVGDIRTVISAQATYDGATGGYATLECLAEPQSCHAAVGTMPLIDSALAVAGPRRGYERTFVPGPTGPNGLLSYAYVAVPSVPGRSGRRGFCADARAIICYTTDGTAPRVVDGECDLSSCEPLN